MQFSSLFTRIIRNNLIPLVFSFQEICKSQRFVIFYPLTNISINIPFFLKENHNINHHGKFASSLSDPSDQKKKCFSYFLVARILTIHWKESESFHYIGVGFFLSTMRWNSFLRNNLSFSHKIFCDNSIKIHLVSK